MTFVFQSAAADEYREAVEYIRKDSLKSAQLFVERVEAAIAYILRHPDANIRGRHDTLRRKIHRHPYWLVYRRLPSNPDIIEIIALAHERRGEKYWKRRFKEL
jgi:plasmid stabilization system protein ParE